MMPCPECGAPITSEKPCRTYLEEMITWDFEDWMGVGQVHLLTVLCYNLQHPSLYSQNGLAYAKSILADMMHVELASLHDRERAEAMKMGSDTRTWKITATPEDTGSYEHPVVWAMNAADMVASGKEGYLERVPAWRDSLFASLRASGNI